MRHKSILWVFYCFPALSQHDTLLSKTYTLPAVEVLNSRVKNFSTGQRIVMTDSAGLANRLGSSLADQLFIGNAVFVRQYGAGGLATLSLQGSGDVHSAVVWNGFNLQSIMNGTSDISLAPLFFSDELGIQMGSAAYMWGSGAVGGAVLLNNKPHFGKGFSFKTNTELGSFGLLRQQAKISFGNKYWYASARAMYSEAQNSYTANVENIAREVKHAASKQQGFLAENYVRWRNNTLSARLWLQDNYRQNPPTEVNGNLNHGNIRSNVEYQKTAPKWEWLLRSAWLREQIVFREPLREEKTNSLADVFTAESEFRYNPSQRHQFNLGLNATHQQASVHSQYSGLLGGAQLPDNERYEMGTPTRRLLALFVQYKYTSKNNKWQWQASARQEMVKNTRIPLVPAAGMEFKPTQWLMLKAHATQFFRLPTFNELYWKPGGTPNLLPEKGLNVETSARILGKRNKTSAFYELAAFDRDIQNWIRWVPSGSYWAAKNVAKIHTQGIENRLGAQIKSKQSELYLLVSTSYVTSVNQTSILENDQSLGRQQIFIPMYQANGNVNYRFRGFYFEYNHTYTGYNYIASDHSQWLSPFHLGNVVLSQSKSFNKWTASLVLRIQNMWDANYRTVAAYPMPLRNYQIGMTATFN
jgi:iron complex outermembrane receptor protein